MIKKQKQIIDDNIRFLSADIATDKNSKKCKLDIKVIILVSGCFSVNTTRS